jgi:hypothetical protein
MARVLIEHNETLAGIDKVERKPDGRWDHQSRHHDALINYLLLTCFDILGQAKGYVQFDGWLRSTRVEHQKEREEALATLPASATPACVALHLYKAHLAIYGVKRSFLRFLKEFLAPEARQALLDSIDRHPGGIDDEEKLAFLYDTRNQFTHKGEIVGSPWRGLGPYEANLEDGVLAHHFVPVRWDDPLVYKVRNWPFVLYRTVAHHIDEAIPVFNVELRLHVRLKNGDYHLPKGVTLADLEDPARLQEWCERDAEEIARG